jgi:hypothetical protein
MKSLKQISILFLVLLMLFNCAAKQASYDLPSVQAPAAPIWVASPQAARDTIFIVINLPLQQDIGLAHYVQQAQSDFNSILSNEVELILREYWDGNQKTFSDMEKFELLSKLPQTMERIMSHVQVKDAWEKSGEMVTLCAFDYVEVAEIIVADMNVKDPAFLEFYKTKMHALAERHQ